MKIFSSVREDMVTEFVETLPRFCLYCGSKCWSDSDYPYACRCSQCSSYFHRGFKTCEDMELGGRGLDSYHTCPGSDDLRLLELDDGTLFEVCQNCAELLRGEGFTNDDAEIRDPSVDDSNSDV